MENSRHNPESNNSSYFLLLGTLVSESDDKDEAPLASLVGKPVEISKEIAEHLLETFAGSRKKELISEPPPNRIKKSHPHPSVSFASPPTTKVFSSRPPPHKYNDHPDRNINVQSSTNSLLEELVQTSIPVSDDTQKNSNSQEEIDDIEDNSFHLCQQKLVDSDGGDDPRGSPCGLDLQNHNNDNYASCSPSSSLSKNFRHSDSKTAFDSNLAKRKNINEKEFENAGVSPKKKNCIFRKNENSAIKNVRIQDSDDSDIEDADDGQNNEFSRYDRGEIGECENISRQWNMECRCSECRAKFRK